MLNALNDLDRLLDAAGIVNLHYISFDNPPVRISQEVSALQEQKIPEETVEQSIQTSNTSCNEGTSCTEGIVIVDTEMTYAPIPMKNVNDADHTANHDQTAISLLRMEGGLSIFTLREHQTGSSAPEGLTDPSRHASSAIAGSAVPPRTTLDRLRAGETRP